MAEYKTKLPVDVGAAVSRLDSLIYYGHEIHAW